MSAAELFPGKIAVTVKEFAQAFSVSTSFVDHEIHRGRLQIIGKHKSRRILVSEIDQYIKFCRHRAGQVGGADSLRNGHSLSRSEAGSGARFTRPTRRTTPPPSSLQRRPGRKGAGAVPPQSSTA